ncbi:MAG: 2-oxo acid dehydrogenase subunit E2 [Waddliaceae bacterium]
MKTLPIKVPTMGEGLQEVKIIHLLKREGEQIEKDAVIYTMQTDKATTEIESPYSGKLVKWLVNEGDVVALDSLVAMIETTLPDENNNEQIENQQHHLESKVQTVDKLKPTIPPRTRAYAKSLSILPEDLVNIVAANGRKLLPSDVDAYLEAKGGQSSEFVTRELSSAQQNLIFQFKRSQEQVVQATVTANLDVSRFASLLPLLNETLHQSTVGQFVSEFQLLAYYVVKAAQDFPQFRSTYSGGNAIKQYQDVNLGIAVHSADNELMTAKISKANTLTMNEFIKVFSHKVEQAMQGRDQADESIQIVLSYLGKGSIVSATPILVAPAIATLFIGGIQSLADGKRIVNLSLSFNHLVINGYDAAKFLAHLEDSLLQIEPQQEKGQFPQKNYSNATAITDIFSLEQWLTQTASTLLGHTIDNDVNLGMQGMDSIQAMSMIASISEQFTINLLPTLIWHYPTIHSIAHHIAPMIGIKASTAKNENMPLEELLEEIKQYSQEEIYALLEGLSE